MVGIYISIRFEPKMALAAFIAMVHDVLVAVGIYSLFNFQVTPDTVVAILTILGYSLYDTVVVFDRVRDNTKNIGSSGRITYTQLINLSMNQTLARSINTSAVAIIPVLGGAVDRRRVPRRLHPAGVRAGALRRAAERGLLVHLHRRADPRHDEEPRAALGRHRAPARHPRRPGRRPVPGGRGRPHHPDEHCGRRPAHRRETRQAHRIRSVPGRRTGTAVLDRPPASGDGARQPPRPRKGKRKRKR